MSRLDDRRDVRDGLKTLGRAPVIAAVDLGASKIGCFIMKGDGAKRDTRMIEVSGVAHVKSRGCALARSSTLRRRLRRWRRRLSGPRPWRGSMSPASPSPRPAASL